MRGGGSLGLKGGGGRRQYPQEDRRQYPCSDQHLLVHAQPGSCEHLSSVPKHLLLSLKPDACFPEAGRRRDTSKQPAEVTAGLPPPPARTSASKASSQAAPPSAHGSDRSVGISGIHVCQGVQPHVTWPGSERSGGGCRPGGRGAAQREPLTPLDACPGLCLCGCCRSRAGSHVREVCSFLST